MARGENPGGVISRRIHNDLLFSETADYGNTNANKDLALGFNNNLAGDGDVILGKFLDVDKNQDGSVLVSGEPLIFRKSGATINPGDKIVGAGGGKVKTGTAANGRGRVLEVLESGDNGRILVLFPG